MQSQPNFLTTVQLASILQIDEKTVNMLVNAGTIPHSYINDSDTQGAILRFRPALITGWLKQGPMNMIDEQAHLKKLKDHYKEKFPEALKALQEFDRQSAGKKPKGFTLAKIKNNEYGFLYYVRYVENKKLIPSRWSTHTNNRTIAEQYARDNRERILANYHYKKEHGVYPILSSYYKNNSKYIETDKKRGRILSVKTRSIYYNFTNKVLIPFLRKKGIKEFDEITPPVITDLQNYLLAKGNKPQTINRFLGSFRAILDYLVIHGTIGENVFDKATMLKVKKQNYTVRNCHEIHDLKGVFNKPWDDELSYMLCLMIYSTGIRNSEIENIQVRDLGLIDGHYFLNVKKSKTDNGVRKIPLHKFVYKRLTNYTRLRGMKADDYIFAPGGRKIQSPVYRKANADMGAVLGRGGDPEKAGISFYSGRHFWKTMMNAEGLGDIEEYFMGHKVSQDVAKRYNHLDKQGKRKLLEKAREIYKILDRYLF
jgi:integrase